MIVRTLLRLFLCLLALMPAAHAQMTPLPAPQISVANCHPGDQWQVQQNGIMRCQPILPPDSCANHGLYDTSQGGGSTFIAGVGTCYYPYTPPAGPVCQFAFNAAVNYAVMLAPLPGSCTADGGCTLDGAFVYYGTGMNVWQYYPLPNLGSYIDINGYVNYAAAANAALAGTGFSVGALEFTGGSNGNRDPDQYFAVCH